MPSVGDAEPTRRPWDRAGWGGHVMRIWLSWNREGAERRAPQGLHALFVLVFFVSGAAALTFETLWFHQAGLMLGNGVWASSIVIASLMAGLGLGNALAGRFGDAPRHPAALYAALEAATGLAGFCAVFLFPAATPALVGAFRALLEHTALLNALRAAVAFLVILAPSTAMGATLPVLVRALAAPHLDFGRVVGRLYGWNTLGAMAGALLADGFLLPSYGIRGTAGLAAAANLLVSIAAFAIAARLGPAQPAAPERVGAPLPAPAVRLLVSASLAGGLLLALEVAWFRLTELFTVGTSSAFAVMLAVVLLGIGLGSLVASLWLRVRPSAHESLPALAALAGVSVVSTYAAFAGITRSDAGIFFYQSWPIAGAAGRLMLPTSFLSGAIFTLLAKSLKEHVGGVARAAGLVTLANTAGATIGALAGGFLLLPRLGTERTLWVLACGYGLVALGTVPAGRTRRADWVPVAVVSGALLVFAAVLFPFGLMRNHYLAIVEGRWHDGARIEAVRETPSETLIYLRKDLWGQPVFHRLVVNGFSMSSTQYAPRRYMNLFVYLPLALHPSPRRALVICYGVGSTARAATDTAELQSIDIVDTSREVLDMGRRLFEGPGPLDDPRVRVHVEDGRFFLQATTERYDLITGEPPPPKNAGVTSLYSREYFQLLHDRLADGGLATYWLPVYQMEGAEARAVIRAFCDVFGDCSLWTGFGREWILLGSRHALGPGTVDRFTRQWRDPRVAPTLRRLGFEIPELVGSSFLADAPMLWEVTRGTAAVDDDHPRRISSRFPRSADPMYDALMETRGARDRFTASAFIRRMWPPELRASTLAAFEPQAWIDAFALGAYPLPGRLPEIAAMTTQTHLHTPVLWMLGSSVAAQQAALRATELGVEGPGLEEALGIGAFADRDFPTAEEHLRRAQAGSPDAGRLYQVRVLSLCLAGRRAAAGALVDEAAQGPNMKDLASWRWLIGRCGLSARVARSEPPRQH